MSLSHSLYMLRRRTLPFADSTLDSRRRGVGVIRNRCLFYETFYLAAQPAFQYFVRLVLSSASFAIFALKLSFPIFSSLFLLASSRRPFFPYVLLRLHLENDIYFFKKCVRDSESGFDAFSSIKLYAEFFPKNNANKFRFLDVMYMFLMVIDKRKMFFCRITIFENSATIQFNKK